MTVINFPRPIEPWKPFERPFEDLVVEVAATYKKPKVLIEFIRKALALISEGKEKVEMCEDGRPTLWATYLLASRLQATCLNFR